MCTRMHPSEGAIESQGNEKKKQKQKNNNKKTSEDGLYHLFIKISSTGAYSFRIENLEQLDNTQGKTSLTSSDDLATLVIFGSLLMS